MEKKELIEKVIAKLSGDPELLKVVGELTLDEEEIRLAKVQKPNTMYVLTGRVRVKSDSEEPQYHYHPVIEDCLLNPNATENKMICSASLVELQAIQKQLCVICPVDTVILAVGIENFEKLQNQLDETIAGLLESIRHVAETFIAENERRIPTGMFGFDDIYRTVLNNLMLRTKTVIGSALTEESNVVDSVGDVEYEMPFIDYGVDCGEYDDEYDDDCCDEEDGEDSPEYYHGTFFGTIERE